MGRMNLKRAAARRIAHDFDLPIFPVVVNGKKPMHVGWRASATRAREAIDAMWLENPNYNIGVNTDGLIVVDIDPRDGGTESWATLVDEWAICGWVLPKTLEVRTWRGGTHYYFRCPEGVEVRGSVGKNGGIAPGVDIRATGSLVVGPGSTIDGKEYRIVATGDGALAKDKVALGPMWFAELMKKKAARAENAGERITDETPEAVAEVQALVDNHPMVERGYRNDAWYKLAARFGDAGVTIETARDEGWRWVHEKVEGGMDEEEFEKTLASAYGPGRAKAIGCLNPGAIPPHPEMKPIEVGLEKAVGSVESVETEPPKKRRIKSLWFADAWPLSLTHSSKPLVEGLLDEEAFSVTYGASGSGKSFLMLDIAFHIAAGLLWNGKKVRQGAVAYVAAEGGTGIYKRLHALCKHYGIEKVPFVVIPVSVDLLKGNDMKELVEEIKMRQEEIGEPFVYIGIDTVSRVLAGGNENGPEDMGLLVHRFDQLRAVTKAHLNAIHHTGKQAALGARGHSLLKAATDTEIEVAVVIKDKSFNLKVTKQRESEGGKPMRFNFKSIELGVDDRGAKVSSNVITLGVMTVKDMENPDLLRDAVAAKLERESRPNDAAVKVPFIIEAAKEAELADFSAQVSEKNYRDRVTRLLADACSLTRMKRLKRGEYQCLYEDRE